MGWRQSNANNQAKATEGDEINLVPTTTSNSRDRKLGLPKDKSKAKNKNKNKVNGADSERSSTPTDSAAEGRAFELFKRYDVDGKGFLTAREISKAFSEVNPHQLPLSEESLSAAGWDTIKLHEFVWLYQTWQSQDVQSHEESTPVIFVTSLMQNDVFHHYRPQNKTVNRVWVGQRNSDRIIGHGSERGAFQQLMTWIRANSRKALPGSLKIYCIHMKMALDPDKPSPVRDKYGDYCLKGTEVVVALDCPFVLAVCVFVHRCVLCGLVLLRAERFRSEHSGLEALAFILTLNQTHLLPYRELACAATWKNTSQITPMKASSK